MECMNCINIYIGESLSTREIIKLKREILAIPHVVDVEHPRNDPHNLTIEYESHNNMPALLMEELRTKGFHPDITSG